MSFNWKAIQSYDDAEVALYRLLGEMLRRKATLTDLDRIRAFLVNAELPSDGWLGLGEALHRTTSGSPVGYDIWLAWLRTFEDVDVDESGLGSKWIEFGEDLSEGSEAGDFDPNMDVLPGGESEVGPREIDVSATFGGPPTEDDLPSVVDEDDDDSTNMMASQPVLRTGHTGVMGESPTMLLRLIPQGPFSLRIFGQEYDAVDEYTVLTLIKRGLFLGATVRFGDRWLPAADHPAFERISERMRSEAARILSRDTDGPSTDPLT